MASESAITQPNPRLASPLFGLFFSLLLATSQLTAQTSPGSEASWTLGETDCAIGSQDWKVCQSTSQFHSTPSGWQLDIKSGWGTKILATTPVSPSYIIDELQPSVWIKSSRSGIQLYARAVLPNTPDPREEGPVTILLAGPVGVAAPRWQKLDFADIRETLPKLLEQAVWKLRTRFDIRVDTSEAYIDSVVLNVYSGPGSNTVWIDDLNIDGAVPVNLNKVTNNVSNDTRYSVRQVAFQQLTGNPERRPALSRCNSNILEVRDQPFFVRIIQFNGEPFEMLRDLGFNTIELSQTATIQQLRQVETLDMWIVCPPPASAGVEPISSDFDRVLAWTLDSERWLNDMNQLTNRVREIRQSDFRENRPVVAFANTYMYDLAHVADIISTGFEPIGGSFILSQYSDWIQQRMQLAQNKMPFWATIQTEMPESIRQQTAAIAMTVPPLPLDASQIKFMAYEAIASGARGMRFVSRSRLDGGDPVSRLRRLTLQWLNSHLRHMEPWICGGAVVNRTESADRNQQLTTLSTPLGRLILIQRASQYEQWVAGDASVSTFRFSDPSMGTSEQPYHLSENGLMLLDSGREISGNEIQVENCGPLEAVVITNEPLVVNRMAETFLIAAGQSQSDLHLEITNQWLAIAQFVNEQLARMGQGNATASGLINDANNALRQAQSLVASGSSMTANRLLFLADQHLASARRNILDGSRSRFTSAVSSPLLSHVTLVPLHFDLTNRIDPGAWQPNGLAGGDFENLELMTSNQWENHRSTLNGFNTHVELATSRVVRGSSALLMKVEPHDQFGDDSLVDRTPLWIHSGPVPVRAGQLVRIHGWINVPQYIKGSLEGLRIADSIGGPELAERISLTSGWQEFSVYRCPAQDTQLRITFEMTGVGQAFIDEVQVNLIDLSGSTSATLQQPTATTEPAGQFQPARPRQSNSSVDPNIDF